MDLEHLQLSALLFVATLELRQPRAGLDGSERQRSGWRPRRPGRWRPGGDG